MLIKRLKNILAPAKLWSFALVRGDGSSPPRVPVDLAEIRLFSSRRRRWGRTADHPHTQADPFLIVRDDRLYIFYEAMRPGRPGEIAACSTNDLCQFDDHGAVLAEPHHLSFPFVFEVDGAAYVLPEASQGDGLWLYRFNRFPFDPVRTHKLSDQSLVDSFLHFHAGRWYLFATEETRLILMVGGASISDPFVEHPLSPICSDLRFSRSGGAMWRGGKRLFRPAQDCSDRYGANLSWLEITELSPSTYAERLDAQNVVELARPWNFDGAHHVSETQFRGESVVAIDGRHHDYWSNRFSRLLSSTRSNSAH